MEIQQNPVSLFFTVTTALTTPSHLMVITRNPERDYPAFLHNNLRTLKDTNGKYGDHWLVRADFPDQPNIPRFESAIEGRLLATLGQMIELQDSKNPIRLHVTTLNDIAYCQEHNIPFDSPQASHHNLQKHFAYGINPYELPIPVIPAVRTDRGIHLFSSSEKGEQAMKRCFRYYAGHFFRKDRCTDTLEIVSALPLNRPLSAYNGNKFNEFSDWDIPSKRLFASYFNREPCLLLAEQQFDMHPTLKNYHEMIYSLDIDSPCQNFDFTCLEQIKQGICLPNELIGEWNESFSFKDRFDELNDEWDDCDDDSERAEVAGKMVARAQSVLTKEFPEYHCLPEPDTNIRHDIATDEEQFFIEPSPEKVHSL